MRGLNLGKTGWCLTGRHHRCSHRKGGPCHGGIALTGGGHYSCPCDCHHADVTRQLELFEAIA